MAYGYKAHYGYYIDPNGQAQGQVTDLDGKNINDCVLTDKNSQYFVPEAKDVVSPTIASYSSDRTARGHRFRDEQTSNRGITDWKYFSLIPRQPAVTSLNDQDYFDYAYWSMCQLPLKENYSPFTIVDQKKKGNPFRYCPKLCKAMYPDLFGKLACTFVYLWNQHKLIDMFGNLYTVGSSGAITRVLSGNAYTGSYIAPTSYSGGTVTWNARFLYVIPVVHQGVPDIAIYNCEVDGRGGGAYEWIVWADNDLVQSAAAVTAFYGFKTDGYDYKSAVGEDPDPYSPGGGSKPGGGGGGGTVPDPEPTPIPGTNDFISVSGLNLYAPTAGEVSALISEMWSTNFINLIEKTILQPMDTIVALLGLPYEVNTGASQTPIILGNYQAAVTADQAFQYKHIDCGSLNITEIWGSYLDYHCRISLYLPFIGTVMLQPEDVLEKSLNVQYAFDGITGTCIAYVISDDVVIGQFAGNCAYQIPLSGANYNDLMGNLINMAGAAIATAAAAASGGVTAPIAAADAASALNVITSKENHQRSGGLGGSNAAMNVRTPYLTIYVPNQCVPEGQNAFTGYPSYITAVLGDQSGFTQVHACHISAAGASDEELQEIESLLKKGVLI